MQASARQQELERLYNARKGHVPQISISDDTHHITEAIGSYYGSDGETTGLGVKADPRPLSYMSSASEARFTTMPRSTSLSNRGAGHYEPQYTERPAMPVRRSSERIPQSSVTESAISPTSIKRMSSLNTNNVNGTAPSLSRHNSTDTAVQQFPLNDIDYESSPAAVAQELSNLQAIRRMSMNVDMADPDLPSFGSLSAVPGPPGHTTSEDDPSKLFWVPARLHPELAPKEFKTFVEERVDKIRRRSGSEESLSPESLERSGSGGDLRRKKSMLSHSIDTRGNYEDGAERLERKRSKGMRVEGSTTIANLHDLEELVNDPAQLVRRMSLDTSRRSEDSFSDTPVGEDVILATGPQTLKRSTRTTYRRGSLRKGERVPFSRRAASRQSDNEHQDDGGHSQQSSGDFDVPILGLTRVQTEPIPEIPHFEDEQIASSIAQESASLSASYDNAPYGQAFSDDFQRSQTMPVNSHHAYSTPQHPEQSQYQQRTEPEQPARPQPKQFHSRFASQGRTTAQLPGYNNTNPLPNIIETLPDGTKIPVSSHNNQAQHFPERKSSIEVRTPRGGAHMRPVPGRQQTPSSTLEDISSNPSMLPGSGATRTDALTMVPTFEDRKSDKKEGGRKSSWKWILGNDDEKKDSKKASGDDASSLKSSKSGKLSKTDKARFDLLQSSIEGNTISRPRESLVLNRDDIRIEDERKGSSKKSFDITRKDKEAKEPSLLSTIFGGKKKSTDPDYKEKKRKNDRTLSPEPPPRLLKADIDYNWTRFSILEERAIYRMAHIKLANPRRALYSQVLLSNFMYSYLAKVQMMHPTMNIPQQPSKQQEQQRQQKKEAQPSEYPDYQRWHEQQSSQQPAEQSQTQSAGHYDNGTEAAYASYEHDEQADYHSSASEGHPEWPDYRDSSSQHSGQRSNEPMRNDGGYSVASGHDYLGYGKDQRGYSNDQMWENEESEELW